MTSARPAHDWDDSYIGHPPPWDIGRPQSAFTRLANTGALSGSLLDAGCGTGEHTILAARHGARALGVDVSPRAIEIARRKAAERDLEPSFQVFDALRLDTLGESFDTIVDSGLFHVFDDADRARYVTVVQSVLRPGGHLHLMCFSNRQPGDWGPRRVTERELLAAFDSGWCIDSLTPTASRSTQTWARLPPKLGSPTSSGWRSGKGTGDLFPEATYRIFTIVFPLQTIGGLSKPTELSQRRRIGVLLICSMSLLIVGLDVTIVNVALPSIGHDFHASVSGLQWTVDAYTLVLASLLTLSGSTADRLGRKRTFITGLLMFSAGSLLCSLSPNLTMLVIFRMVQAVGGSMLNPVAMSIITNTFTDARERAQAVGVWAAVVGVSMALGPVVGGLLVGSVGWRSIFWINLPVGLAALLLTLRYIPESRAPKSRRGDSAGQVLMIVLLASLTYGIIEAPDRGWGSPVIMAAFALAASALTGLIIWERRRDEPLIDLRFFQSIPFSGAAIIAVAAFAAQGGFLFLNTLYLQEVRGFSPLRAGVCTLPMAVMTILLPPISGRIVGTRGPRVPLLIAGSALTASCIMLSRIQAHTPFTWLFGAYVIFGIGFGFVNAPITNAAVSGMPRTQAGVAAAIASTSRQVGATLGVAVVGALLASALRRSGSAVVASATHAGWLVLAGSGTAVFVLGLVVTTSWAHRTADHTARELNPEFLVGQTR